MTAEATASWGGLLADLQRRGLPAPLLVVTDGHAGSEEGAGGLADGPRATVHDAQGAQPRGRVPVHARPELKRDYDRIIYAADPASTPARPMTPS